MNLRCYGVKNRAGTAARDQLRTGLAGLVAALTALLVLAPAAPAAAQDAIAAPPSAPTTAAGIQDLCATAALGQARCLSERLTTPAVRAAVTGAGTASPSSTPGGLGPSDLISAYQLDATKGFGQTVAIIDAYDDPTAATDLAVYRAQYGLPACTVANGCFSKLNQNGATGPLPVANSGWAGEISLDVDMVSAICPQCSIMLIEANSSYLSDLGAAVDTAVRLGAKFVSNSYGGGEYSGVGGNDVHFNHPGVAITASTGDNGYGTSYPASSPYVTAVGGTSLTRTTGGRGWTETTWAGAGSGCSGYESRPPMQDTVATGCANRAMADVSAVANPNTGVAVYNGGWGVYGGTSASSPIIASVYALAGTPGATDYPNRYPYSNSSSLYDVTAGTNGSCSVHALCSAGAGWDGPTGLGTPNTAAAFSATGVVSGTPAKFGATAAVSGAAIAGLPTTLIATPLLPDGDSLASISWKSNRTDCTITAPTALQTGFSCPATVTGTLSVTATLTDAAAASKTVTVPVVYTVPSSKRAVAISYNVLGQSGPGQNVCTGANTALRAVVTDVATGTPVRGLTVSFVKAIGTAAATAAGSALSAVDGGAASTVAATAAMTLTARTAAAGAFTANVTGTAFDITAGKCVPTLTGAAGASSSYYADPVVVTGTLTRDAAGSQIPLAGAAVQVTELVAGHSTVLATATTGADGSLRVVLKPTTSGTLGLNLPAAAGWNAVSTALGSLTVQVPTTTITAVGNLAAIGFANPLLVSGTLQRVAGSSTTALTGALVSIRTVSATGIVTILGTTSVSASGTWSATVHPRTTGELFAVYAGGPGLPAVSADAGALTVGTWNAFIGINVQYGQQVAGAGNRVTGAVTRSYGTESGAAPGVPVRIYEQTSTGAQVLLASTVTGTTGAFSVVAAPAENGALTAQVVSVPGYVDAVSPSASVAVSSFVSVTAPSVALLGKPVTISVLVNAPRAASLVVEEFDGTAWQPLGSVTTPATGRGLLTLTGLAAGTHTVRVSFAGDSRGSAGHSTSLAVLIR